MLNYTKLNRF